MEKNKREYSVYQHINLLNNKKYIGITKQNCESRWGTNGINYKSSPHFYSAIIKYGWDNFKHEILYSNLTKEEACELEKQLIKENNTQNKKFGYNIMEGGEAPSIPDEIKNVLSEKLKGNKNNLGNNLSEETKKKISEAQKGRKFTEEHKMKISLSKKGKTHKPISIESRKKIADKHKKKQVLCIELNKVYESIQECARQLNLHANFICKCCKGKLKTTGGFHFKYYNEEDNI